MNFRQRVLFLGSGLFCGGLIFIHSPIFEGYLRNNIAESMSQATGEDVWLGDLSLSVLGRTIEIGGASMTVHGKNEPFVNIQNIQLKFKLPFDGRWVDSLDIIKPRVQLIYDEHGLIPFRNRPISVNEPKDYFPWRQMNIDSGDFFIEKGADGCSA